MNVLEAPIKLFLLFIAREYNSLSRANSFFSIWFSTEQLIFGYGNDGYGNDISWLIWVCAASRARRNYRRIFRTYTCKIRSIFIY